MMALIMSSSSVSLSPIFTLNQNQRLLHPRVLVKSVGGDDSVTLSGGSAKKDASKELEPFWDDGYGTQTMRDCAEKIAMDLVKSDGGPPRWFCPVACGKPLIDSPVLLYLPGIDGTGAGLVVHEKPLGKVFHVQCLHIPVWDRTALEGLIQIVEEIVMIEHALSPNKPIYLLGESFGGTLALAVAARNPNIDLILILPNPATSYERSIMHPLSVLVRVLTEEHYEMLPYAMSPLFGDYVKMAMVGITDRNYLQSLWQLPRNLCNDLPLLSLVARVLPKDTLTWRLKLVESAAAYANSRLHAITAQVLILASGKDNLMPSKSEAHRLSRLLKHCNVRLFEENGHTILMESGVNVISAIKASQMYRRSFKHDIIKDCLPLCMTECNSALEETWWYRFFMSDAAMFSTMEDGKIVRGLAGIPDEGPVLVVGNHMLLGWDIYPVILEFLKQKKAVLHGLAHPGLLHFNAEDEQFMTKYTDILHLICAIPVSGRNLFRLLARKSYILLYPGGLREALHRKGEGYKLFWPDKQEFVRMAVKMGATIIPFGGVGEDDILEF
ncbi:diacylglycerol acyltransferase [Artemisia annua]|uniref:Diacylglycerol acyltransferase n=1 Tax=Artemisia annua TaxID=35608 RepID=A0A2U1NUS6_ARTAN|nr:diacylglycerol acyltransferase [Artemisia annua]